MVGDSSQRAKPFLRWAGGKSWLVRKSQDLFSARQFRRYHEPFVGGGAVFLPCPEEPRRPFPTKTLRSLKPTLEVWLGAMSDLRSTIRRVLAAPETYSAFPVTRIAPDVSRHEHSCSWAQGFGFLLRRASYRDWFIRVRRVRTSLGNRSARHGGFEHFLETWIVSQGL